MGLLKLRHTIPPLMSLMRIKELMIREYLIRTKEKRCFREIPWPTAWRLIMQDISLQGKLISMMISLREQRMWKILQNCTDRNHCQPHTLTGMMNLNLSISQISHQKKDTASNMIRLPRESVQISPILHWTRIIIWNIKSRLTISKLPICLKQLPIKQIINLSILTVIQPMTLTIQIKMQRRLMRSFRWMLHMMKIRKRILLSSQGVKWIR